MKKIKFYFKAFLLITFSKEFKKFEEEYFGANPEIFYKDGEKKISEKEKNYMEIIRKCYNKNILPHG